MKNVLFKTFAVDRVQAESAKFSAEYIAKVLAEKPVLLLLSGGSAIPMYQELGERLVALMPDLSKLTISLFDERYVAVDSQDSNALQLKEKGIAGLFTGAGATWLPYLNDGAESGVIVASRVSEEFEKLLNDGAVLVVLAGMGDDAHTAGLLPTNDEATIKNLFNSDQYVAYYDVPEDAPNPYRHRLTSTPKLIEQAQQVLLYALGDKKQVAMKRLVTGSEQIAQCPVLSLRHSQSDVILFTDQESV